MIRELLEKGPLVIAHRGDLFKSPQNTSHSFLSAMEYDIDMIETDLNMTKDERIVIIHDQRVDNTSNGTGRVMDYTLKELKKLDFGSWMGEGFSGERILTLEEFIELTIEKIPALNLEIKNCPIKYGGIGERVISVLREYDIIDRVVISSFDHALIRRVKEIESNVVTGILYQAGLIDHITPAREAMADALHPDHSCVDADMVRAAREAGLYVNVWTVDDEERMEELVRMGVSGLISNVPDRLSRVVKGK